MKCTNRARVALHPADCQDKGTSGPGLSPNFQIVMTKQVADTKSRPHPPLRAFLAPVARRSTHTTASFLALSGVSPSSQSLRLYHTPWQVSIATRRNPKIIRLAWLAVLLSLCTFSFAE